MEKTAPIFLIIAISAYLYGSAVAIKCYTCLPNKAAGRDCRSIGNQVPQNCPEDSKHCVALVIGTKEGDISVSRGCGNHVQDFNLGADECNMLDRFSDDLPAAYYKCKTDGCNNIEPVTTEVTEIVSPQIQPAQPQPVSANNTNPNAK